MPARPADAMCIIEIEVQTFITSLQALKLQDWCQIAVHAIHAVREVPDSPVGSVELTDPMLELPEVIVTNELNSNSCASQLTSGKLHTCVDMMVE
jgi:hypothetical protein